MAKRSRKSLRKLVILMIIIFLVALVVFISSCIIKMKNSNFYTRDVVKDMLMSGIDNLNYSYKEDEDKTEVFVLGKLSKVVKENGEVTYNNYDNKKSYTTYSNSNFMEEFSNSGTQNIDYYQKYIKCYFEDYKYEYKYIKKAKVDGSKCVVVELYSELGKGGIRLWISEESNLIVKDQWFNVENGKKVYFEEVNQAFNSGENQKSSMEMTQEMISSHSTGTNN